MKLLVGVVVVVMVAGCGTEPPYAGLLKPPPSGQGMQLDLKLTLQPGEEQTVCKNFAIPSGTFDIGRFEHAMNESSHHLLVYQLALGASAITDDLIPHCDEDANAAQYRIGYLYGSQSPTSDLRLPKGIAFTQTGGFSVQMEFHILNNTDQPMDAEAALNLWKAAEPVTGDAGALLLYHPLIALPPGQSGMVRQRCPIVEDIQVMNLIPHMHARGTGMQISLDTGSGPQQIVDAQSWHAESVSFDPPLTIPAGSVIDYQCEFDNTTSMFISDGNSARKNEMCVTGGIYIVPNGARMAQDDEMCFGKQIIYSGAKTCSQVDACNRAIDWSNWNVSPDPWQQQELCRTAACQGGGDAFSAFNACRRKVCGNQCYTETDRVVGLKFEDPACTACLQASCGAEQSACAASTCP